ncbi:Phosphoglucosamine mutase [Hyella patelloides LEGE 07179]|uniref:Phosphoglucosamine mutase n=1 Tax=Hyella patelloides LEGE 07179 TaxID=945734 RepID=A0A563VLU0_9CYAN|nr:phosphoglucosamine mutase [Hyella patelloides]VEP12420.1 Phosphoglucosamine mutase [Hyella patelloides LEGE 07179]
MSKQILEKFSLDSNTLPITRLFGTDGIRSKAGELLNANFALQLGYWVGTVLQEQANERGAVVIGQDSRNSSDMLAMAMSSGLTAAGLEVWHLGLCPTPCVAAVTNTTDAIGGIMISASHNPPEDNGIKFFNSKGIKLADNLAQEIETRLRANYNNFNCADTANQWGKHYYRPGLIDNYTAMVQRSLIPNLNFQGMKIVLDLAWGASVNLAPVMFEQLGAEVILLHQLPDGDRINVNCGSTHLDTLRQAMLEHQANLGFAFDGDADRVMAVDCQGRVVDGDYILYLWGNKLKEQGELPDDLIIATVMANLGFERAWQQTGGKLIRTAVGDRHVQAEMWRTGAMLGGEQSGHILCHHHGVSGDGIQTALHLASLVAQSGASLTQLVNSSFQTYPQILRNVRVECREKRSQWQECELIQKAISQAETAMGNEGRILVRASGTEPVIRVMVEAINQELTNHWTDQLVRVVETNLAV